MTPEQFATLAFVIVAAVVFLGGTYAADKTWTNAGEVFLFLCVCVIASFVLVGAGYTLYVTFSGEQSCLIC
jgi:hypothetical protein